MSTFLFVSMPVLAHTTNPMPFAARLVERGHTVLWLSGRNYHDRLTRTGAVPLAYEHTTDFSATLITDAFPQLTGLKGIANIRRAFADVFVGEADRRVADIRRVLDRHHIDAMLSDPISFGPGLVHEIGGPPWATYGDGPVPFANPDTPPFGPGLLPMRGRVGRTRNRLARGLIDRAVFTPSQQRLDEIREGLGLPRGQTVLEAVASPFLHLHGCMPGFEYPMTNPPPQLHFVGPLRPDPIPWTPPAWWEMVANSDRPMVFVSQGSLRPDAGELMVPTIRALATLDAHVVVATGAAKPADLPLLLGGSVPTNTLVTDFVPYDLALARADCFVTNGGYTGVTLALRHGTPMVQAGITEEKSEIGARITWSGTGIRLRTSRPSPARIRRAVSRVLDDPRYAMAAGRLSRQAEGLDAGRMGAELLEQLAETGRPVTGQARARNSHQGP